MNKLSSLGLVLLLSACGSKVDSSESTPADTGVEVSVDAPVGDAAPEASTAPTEERTCKRLADAMCSPATQACCTRLSIPWAGAGCREAAMAYCTGRIDAVTSGQATYDDSKLEECAKSWESSGAKCESEFIPYLRGSTACAQLFNGTKPPGSACTSSVECQAPAGMASYCDSSAKRCRASTVVGEGASCNFTGSTLRYCDEGLYCDLTGATSACKKQLAAGADCSSSNYIACGYSHTCVEGKCGTGLAGGATCVENFECSSWTCNAGKCNSVLYQLVDKGLCNGGTAG